MNRLEEAEQRLQDFKDQLNNLETKIYAKIRQRAQLEEDKEKELENECDITKISEYKTKIDAATMIIDELKKKTNRLKNTDIPWAENKLNEVKGMMSGIKHKINQKKINNNTTSKKLEKAREELKHTIKIYEKDIKRNKKDIDNLKEKYENISGKKPELYDESKIEELSNRAILESKYGIVDKKLE